MKLLNFFILLSIALFIGSCTHKARVAVPSISDEAVKVAMILPEKRIGRYAHTTSTAIFAYFLTREHPYTLKIFQINDESPEEIKRVLEEIKEQAFSYIIAPVTPKGAGVIAEQEEELTIFFPTIHKHDLPSASENIYFGAIDYRAQIEKLSSLASSPLVIMYDKSLQGMKLLEMTKKSYNEQTAPFYKTGRQKAALEEKTTYEPSLEPKNKKTVSYAIDKKRSNLKYMLQDNKQIQFGSFFLNTPVIKSTMILSQVSVYDTAITNALSTQINYDPLILTMTQSRDREKLYIANSISTQNDTVIQANTLLNNDIVYDWINYASTVGADYFYHMITGEERLYELPMINNQIIYPIAIMQPTNSHFKRVEVH